MTNISEYMDKIIKLIDKSEDPYARQYREQLINAMREQVTKNWIESGEPQLTPEQVSDIYNGVLKSNDQLMEFNGPVYTLKLEKNKLDFIFFPN